MKLQNEMPNQNLKLTLQHQQYQQHQQHQQYQQQQQQQQQLQLQQQIQIQMLQSQQQIQLSIAHHAQPQYPPHPVYFSAQQMLPQHLPAPYLNQAPHWPRFTAQAVPHLPNPLWPDPQLTRFNHRNVSHANRHQHHNQTTVTQIIRGINRPLQQQVGYNG